VQQAIQPTQDSELRSFFLEAGISVVEAPVPEAPVPEAPVPEAPVPGAPVPGAPAVPQPDAPVSFVLGECTNVRSPAHKLCFTSTVSPVLHNFTVHCCACIADGGQLKLMVGPAPLCCLQAQHQAPGPNVEASVRLWLLSMSVQPQDHWQGLSGWQALLGQVAQRLLHNHVGESDLHRFFIAAGLPDSLVLPLHLPGLPVVAVGPADGVAVLHGLVNK
jgi:hypothetical protein